MHSLTSLIHGPPKVGKSTVCATSPKPTLLIDAEGSTKFLPIKMKRWDPRSSPPPEVDGSWEAAVVVVSDFNVLVATLNYLEQHSHPFKSIVIDSVTEVQRKLKQQLVGYNSMEWGNWDELLRKLDVLLRSFRDLTEHPKNPLQAATFTCETKNIDGKWRPNVQGGIKDNLPYFFDVYGYLWQEIEKDPSGKAIVDPKTGKPLKKSRLLISAANDIFGAGERVQGRLPDLIDNPNLCDMLITVFPQVESEVDFGSTKDNQHLPKPEEA